jgi:transcription termination factor Rho
MNQQEKKAVSGVLEILPKGFGFLRNPENDYQPERTDTHVPASTIRSQKLKEGSMVEGQAVSAKGNSLQLKLLDRIDGVSPEDYRQLPEFTKLTSVDPYERLQIDASGDLSMRVVDLFTPIGKGQRALIVAAPRTGKTTLLRKLARSIVDAHPEVYLTAVLINERPEEVTEMRRGIRGEVIAASSDETARKHIQVAEMVLRRARRMVEAGKDVVILLDSITRLARAYNMEEKGTGRTLSGGLGAGTMTKPREFFGAARKAEEGGSLTIIATALVDTGSRMDDVIFEEFKGTGNMELVLDRSLAERRIWPAIDIFASGTRKEEKLRTPEAQQKVNLLRRALAGQSPQHVMEKLLPRLEKTQDNEQFLSLIQA